MAASAKNTQPYVMEETDEDSQSNTNTVNEDLLSESYTLSYSHVSAFKKSALNGAGLISYNAPQKIEESKFKGSIVASNNNSELQKSLALRLVILATLSGKQKFQRFFTQWRLTANSASAKERLYNAT